MSDIHKFIQGFKRFQKNYFGKDSNLYQELKTGQHPKATIIACSDSRSDPAMITDCDPGDLFVVRNVANLVPPCEHDQSHHGVSAALEYSVCQLKVNHIIVLGHSQCGGIRALLQGDETCRQGEFIGFWMSVAESARQMVLTELAFAKPDEQERACEQAAILISLENLMTFSWIAERVENETLALHGWYFDMQHGELLYYDHETGDFEVLVIRD